MYLFGMSPSLVVECRGQPETHKNTQTIKVDSARYVCVCVYNSNNQIEEVINLKVGDTGKIEGRKHRWRVIECYLN